MPPPLSPTLAAMPESYAFFPEAAFDAFTLDVDDATTITSEDGGEEEPPAANVGDCCEPNGSQGCEASACEAAVCATDAYCCDTDWDIACSSAAATLTACDSVCG